MPQILRFLNIILLLPALWLLAAPAISAAQVDTYLGSFESQDAADLADEIQHAYLQRNYEEAWKLAKRGVSEYPNSFNLARHYIEIANRTNNIPTALAHFSKQINDPATKATGHYGQGWAAVLLGDMPSAFRELTLARELHGTPDLEIRRAMLVGRRFAQETNEKKLLNDYQQFVADYNEVGLAHLSFVNTFNYFSRDSKRHSAAIEAALGAPNTAPEIWLRKADLMERDLWFDPAGGLTVVEDGLKKYPWHADLALRRIEYIRQLGQTERALEVTREWREIAPNHGDFINVEYQILSDLHRWDEAIKAAAALDDLTFQKDYKESRAIAQARLYHTSGRGDEAIEVLEEYLRSNPSSRFATEANAFLMALRQRDPEDKVRLIENVCYIRQKGNYCGPASLSMLLHNFGIDQTQDQIARNVYTGIAGTPPQVIHNYLETQGLDSIEFNGDEEVWKRLIDAGYPVLWLKMLGRRGGHYYLIVGYDDVLQEWLVHNPNYATRTRVPYDRVDDEWILPGLKRSIVAFPEGERDNPVFAGLGPTPLLFATNWLLYVATGSNLLRGFFPGFLVNVAFASIFALVISFLVRRITFPNRELLPSWFLGAVLALVIPLNVLVATMRSGEAVSLLLGLHLGLMTLIPLLLLLFVIQRVIHDFLHPRESIGLCVVTLLVWLSLSLVDRQPWETIIPLAFFLGGLPIILAPRFRIKRGESAMRYGDAVRALEAVRPYGLHGRRYFSATCIEMDGLLAMGENRQLIRFSEEALKSSHWPRLNEEAIELHRLIGQVLLEPNHETREFVEAFIERKKLSKAARLVARALLLYIDGFLLSSSPELPIWSEQEIDSLIAELHRAAESKLPGVPPTRASRSYAILQAAALMAFHGGLAHAVHTGNEEQREMLWRVYGQRRGLLFQLFRGIERIDQLQPGSFAFFPQTEIPPAPDAESETTSTGSSRATV